MSYIVPMNAVGRFKLLRAIGRPHKSEEDDTL
jgi:hypothetical protein